MRTPILALSLDGSDFLPLCFAFNGGKMHYIKQILQVQDVFNKLVCFTNELILMCEACLLEQELNLDSISFLSFTEDKGSHRNCDSPTLTRNGKHFEHSLPRLKIISTGRQVHTHENY